jgi:ABC-2 type transport system permease protein
MRELAMMTAARARMIRAAAGEFVRDSKLRVVVVCGLIVLFWMLMFVMFLDGFRFLSTFRAISDVLLDYLFAFFFVSLLAMMAMSNAIIAYTSLFRSEETAFFFTLPVHAESTFVYRAADSVVFSCWGMVTLVLPMILAYGIRFTVPAYFYPVSLVLAMLFILLTTELGGFLALAAGLLLPRRRKTVLITLGTVTALLLGSWFGPLLWRRPESLFTEAGIKSIMDRISFCQHWALPSRWVSHGMLSAARGDLRQATRLGLTLLANVLFLGMVSHRFAFHAYRRTWGTLQGASARRVYLPQAWLDGFLQRALAFLPLRLRLLVVKDLKTFLRDPSQWSQFLLFFGLLGLYILNLPRFGVASLQVYWQSMIANLNLCATCLTLATLTSRFIFPQLSLEGRRIWITGLLPMRRSLILWGKFLFSVVGTFAISGGLICLSDAFLGLPLWTLGVHLLVVAGVCCGLNGLAVGLGALYPRPGTDNPSKIVSSFGGTLNLICSICFLALVLVPIVAPLHLHAVRVLEGPAFAVWLGVGLGAVLTVSAAASLAPMLAGARAFTRMEF